MADGPQVVILAAGQGTRMRSAVPKVLHRLGGLPLVDHVLAVAAGVSDRPAVVVVNAAHDEVADHLSGRAEVVLQPKARGTGDALRSLPETLRSDGAVVVLSADVPLLRAATVRRLLDAYELARPAAALLTVTPVDGSGLGRIIRSEAGTVERIVEERDLEAGTHVSPECNAGVYVFDGSRLWPALDEVGTDNAQGEHYLTDVIELLGGDVIAVTAPDPGEAIGVNDRTQLADAEAALRRRTLTALMLAGVTVEDPATTFVDAGVRVGPDTVLRPMSTLRGGTVLGAGCEIGPMAQLRDVRAGTGVRIGASLLEECELGDAVTVGAYCRVRPNTVLRSGVQLGTHAEVKNSTIGERTHLNHFSCVLDSDVGSDTNIGAGTVTCNYDGEAKHRTTIGDGVFIGTNSTLVAPLTIGDGAYVGAGSFVNTDVPPGALAVGRSRQRNVEGWARRRSEARHE